MKNITKKSEIIEKLAETFGSDVIVTRKQLLSFSKNVLGTEGNLAVPLRWLLNSSEHRTDVRAVYSIASLTSKLASEKAKKVADQTVAETVADTDQDLVSLTDD